MNQMLFILDDLAVYDEATETMFSTLRRLGCSWVSEVSGLVPPTGKHVYMTIYPNETVYYGTLMALSDRNPEVIGVWTREGNQQGYRTDTTTDSEGIILTAVQSLTGESILATFNKSLYTSLLAPVITLDSEGQVVSSVPADPETQVPNFYGWKPRDLTDRS